MNILADPSTNDEAVFLDQVDDDWRVMPAWLQRLGDAPTLDGGNCSLLESPGTTHVTNPLTDFNSLTEDDWSPMPWWESNQTEQMKQISPNLAEHNQHRCELEVGWFDADFRFCDDDGDDETATGLGSGSSEDGEDDSDDNGASLEPSTACGAAFNMPSGLRPPPGLEGSFDIPWGVRPPPGLEDVSAISVHAQLELAAQLSSTNSNFTSYFCSPLLALESIETFQPWLMLDVAFSLESDSSSSTTRSLE